MAKKTHRYSRISTLDDIQIEKQRLRRKIRKQEKTLTKNWKQIEDSWQVVNKIANTVNKLFSSASVLAGAEIGYHILSHLFSKRKKRKETVVSDK